MIEHRVHILGASGSGTTTLGKGLASALGIQNFDADSYFWEPTDPPFTIKRSSDERLRLLTKDIDSQPSWVLSGSIVNWSYILSARFTHVILISLPADIRLARLLERERQAFGARIEPGGDMHKQHQEFIAWAKRYDEGGLDVRSRQLHEAWLTELRVPVLRISGELSREDQVRAVRSFVGA